MHCHGIRLFYRFPAANLPEAACLPRLHVSTFFGLWGSLCNHLMYVTLVSACQHSPSSSFALYVPACGQVPGSDTTALLLSTVKQLVANWEDADTMEYDPFARRGNRLTGGATQYWGSLTRWWFLNTWCVAWCPFDQWTKQYMSH
jgi:hypothetical protein